MLRERTALLRSFVENLTAVAAAKDTGGRYLFANPAFEGLVGAASGDLVGKTDDQLFPPDVAATLRANDRRVLEAEGPLEIEETLALGDGVRVYLSLRFPLRDHDGRIYGIGSISTDITERRRATERLAAQFEATRALAGAATLEEAAPRILEVVGRSLRWDVGILWLVDGRANALKPARLWCVPEVDRRAVEAAHPAAGFARGQGLPGIIWASREPVWLPDIRDDPRIVRRALGERLGLRAIAGFPVVAGDGVLGVIEFLSREARPPEDEVLRMMAAVGSQIGQFIERRRVDRELIESEARYRAILQAVSSYAIIVADQGGRVLSWNAGAERMFGYAEGEVLGKPVSVLMPERFRAAHEQGLERLHRTGESRVVGRTLELAGRRNDGVEFPIELSLAAIRSGDGTYFTGIVQDLTERKRAEEALRKAQEQFLHSQKMEALGRLAGGVAHDFNNLLTTIVGWSEVLLGRLSPDDPSRRPVEEVRRAGERASGLTRQLLAFSRRQALAPRIVDLNAIVADLVKMLGRLVGEDIELETVLAPGLGRVRADPGQIEQVIVNLAVNARDAMPGGGRLTIETAEVDLDASYAREHREVRPGRHVVLIVSDTGHGMDEATRARMFEPFFTTKAPGQGTGLGLSTVYGIVRQAGGHIFVYSEPGHGTTFRIYLPLVPGEAETPAVAPPAPRGGAETVLLCEDDPAVRALMREVLAGHGYRVIEARDGAQAIELGRAHPAEIDLLVTDVVMPGTSGPAVARGCAAANPRLRVVYVSGYTEKWAMGTVGVDAGVAFLQKPFSPDALARKVREVLDAGKTAG